MRRLCIMLMLVLCIFITNWVFNNLMKGFLEKSVLLLDKYNLSSKVKGPKSQILMIISVSANQKRSSPCLNQSETELLTFSYG